MNYAPNITQDMIAEAFSDAESLAPSAPEPLRRPVAPPEPYPVDSLGGILAPACKSLQRVIQAPDAVCAASVLAAASLSAQGQANVLLDGRVCPISLWMLTIAESGERKSAVDSVAMRPIREYEKKLHEFYSEEQRRFLAKQKEYDARVKAAEKAADKRKGEGLANALLALGDAPAAPMLPYVVAADFTAEGIAKLLEKGRPSIGAFTDEAALVFGGHGMSKETVRRTAGTLSKLWDNGTLDRIRAGDGARKLYGKRFAMHLMAQPVIAEAALSDPILSGQGFLARCLLSWPESTAGHRPYRAEDLTNDAALKQYDARLSDLLEMSLPMPDPDNLELKPRSLTLTPSANQLWEQVHNSIEAELSANGEYALVKSWGNKAAEQCLRIAGTLALVANPDASQISVEMIEQASELTLWHLREAVRLSDTAELSPEVRNAEALLLWCHQTGRDLLHSGAALRLGPNCIRERKTFTAAMKVLADASWAIPDPDGAVIDGAHRRNVWKIVREG